jgi:hypothetical protein
MMKYSKINYKEHRCILYASNFGLSGVRSNCTSVWQSKKRIDHIKILNMIPFNYLYSEFIFVVWARLS